MIFRDDVEPAKGGKVPESAHLRVELNIDMIDTAGLRSSEGIRMEQLVAAESPVLLDHMLQDTNSKYHPGLSQVIKLKPGYHPEPAYVPTYGHGHPQPRPVGPVLLQPSPVGPVLLQSRPNEVKSINPLPITVTDTFTSFDCRTRHPGHYADIETNCEILELVIIKTVFSAPLGRGLLSILLTKNMDQSPTKNWLQPRYFLHFIKLLTRNPPHTRSMQNIVFIPQAGSLLYTRVFPQLRNLLLTRNQVPTRSLPPH